MGELSDEAKIKEILLKNVNKLKDEQLVSYGERLISKGEPIEEEVLQKLSNMLILIYDNAFIADNLRERATEVVRSLAIQYVQVFNLVIANAKKYAEIQHIDDSFPYRPNSFDILAKLGKSNSRVISFLKHTVQNDWGIPRWEAIEKLCELNDPQADRFIINVIQGKYPPKKLNSQNDLRHIERIKGKDFIFRYQD